MLSLLSADEPAEHVFYPATELLHGTNVRRRAAAESTGDLDRRDRLTRLRDRNPERARFVSGAAPRRTLRGIQGRGRCALSRLLPQPRIRDPRPADELHELERELVSDELVMGERDVGHV